ncbi:DMT family transporter [Bradyrhizobium prioriisuperbiae]|uniref:DMT family transporter n=1 Tax=Bradyrhizobium prioriisuperbiae TaxID=2854389 RepID=UPI0028E4105D|nr:DMT family transporter [Bradyrhizobium prioritasuperba]
MKLSIANLAVRAAPAIFVVLWSTGFISTKLALTGAEPFTWLALRMAITICLLLIIVALTRPAWPKGSGIFHSAVAGLLVHGVYLAGVTIAIAHSIPAGLSALIPGLQPILTSTLASRFLGERVTPLQWGGLLLGLAGVVLVLHNRSLTGQAGWGWVASIVSLIGITLGTLYQKRFSSRIDWRTGNIVQYAACGIFFGIGALLFETRAIHWHPQFILAVSWATLALSVGSVSLFYFLIRRSGATAVASLFYLTPAVTAVFGYVLFDERLDALAIGGMVLCAIGVVIVNRAAPQ